MVGPTQTQGNKKKSNYVALKPGRSVMTVVAQEMRLEETDDEAWVAMRHAGSPDLEALFLSLPLSLCVCLCVCFRLSWSWLLCCGVGLTTSAAAPRKLKGDEEKQRKVAHKAIDRLVYPGGSVVGPPRKI
jgi:hypothetical protein